MTYAVGTTRCANNASEPSLYFPFASTALSQESRFDRTVLPRYMDQWFPTCEVCVPPSVRGLVYCDRVQNIKRAARTWTKQKSFARSVKYGNQWRSPFTMTILQSNCNRSMQYVCTWKENISWSFIALCCAFRKRLFSCCDTKVIIKVLCFHNRI